MKMFLLITCVTTLLTTTGCFFPGRGGGWGHWHDRGEINVAPAIVEASAPKVIVEPPVVEVRAPEDIED
jgi:hypothetical protein